jgi:hypothetical protein
MFGVMHPIQLEEINIMLFSLMIYSKFTWIYLLKFKSEVFENSMSFKSLWKDSLILKF